MSQPIPSQLRGLSAPYIDQYFGVWAVHPERFAAAVERINSMDLRLHVQQQQEIRAAAPSQAITRSYPYAVDSDGACVIDVCGTLMKQESSLDDSCSTVLLRNTMRKMRQDDSVKRVMLRIDSPGGSAAGTQDLADDVADLAAAKPVHAYIEDLGCSAAYWVGCQSAFISTNRTGIVGSIGTFAAIYDTSARAAMGGIKVTVVSTGPLKGGGAPGAPVSAEQVAEWQAVVNALNAQFLASVGRGRKMSAEKVASIADGGVHVGAAAQARGLVDAVESFDDAMSRLRSASPGGPVQPPTMPRKRSEKSETATPVLTSEQTNPAGGASAGVAPPVPAAPDAPKGKPMSTETSASVAAAAEPKPATISELKAAFAGHAAFALDCAEKALTMNEAKAAYADVLKAENEQFRAAAAAASAKAPDAAAEPARRAGVAALRSAAAEKPARGQATVNADAVDDFEAMVAEHVKAGMDRFDAVAKVARRDPDLHQRYIEAGQGKGRR